jgi:DNA mismatch repair protein MSH6
VRGLLKTLPDLERLLARFHALGSEERSKNHPDGRAILYEMGTYNTRNIDSFVALIEGFETARKIINKMAPLVSSFKSKLLIALLKITRDRYEGLGQLKGYPDYASALTSFRNSFDVNLAKAEKKITPKPGTDVEYEAALVDEKRCIKALNDYLDTMKNRLGCRELKFWGKDKDRFQMEVPDAYTRKCSSDDGFTLKTATKTVKRYYTEESLELFDALKKVEARKTDLAKDTSRRQFNKFSEHYYDWMAAVCCLANLDSLFSLALTSKFGDGRGDCCRPEFVHFNDAPDGSFMEVRKMRHPCVKETYSGSDFIPNDIILGNVGEYCENKSNPFSAGSKSMLLTGPNMGGKSTLLRQACIAAIIAQIGCYVPAAKVRLTPVDRVFTRIGASDRILAGQSTFFVELTETAQIMQYATPSSLIILDELGRGTSTFDGAAIAFAVMKFLCQDTQARTMFSTHYHSLVESFMNDPNVSLGHMGCIVSKATDGSDIDTVTFLYQLKEGTCDRSYGLNVARLAHLPEAVIQDAKVESANFESRLREAMASKSLVSEQNELVQSLLQMNLEDYPEEEVDNLILKANALTAA